MAKFKRYTKADGGYHGELAFFCPGCNCEHFLNDNLTELPNLPQSHIWYFNGNFEKPTISPSYLTYCPTPAVDYRCHSFIKDGLIQFLGDCTHKLANKTVELPEIE